MLPIRSFAASLLILFLGSQALHAQSPVDSGVRRWSSNIIVSGAARQSGSQQIRVTGVDAKVKIVEQLATTTLEIGLHNRARSQDTAELLLPVPEGAVVKSFTFQGDGAEPSTELLSKDRARQTFDSIVARLKDPALLEFAGYNLVRTSVFPVPANGNQKVRIVYEALLNAEGDRVDYVLPRSGSVLYSTPWNISVAIHSKRNVTAVYSPSHALATGPVNRKSVAAEVAETATRNPGEFKLSYLLENGAVTASMFAYPDADGKSGYFLMLAGTGEREALAGAEKIKREITLVIDRSGSMAGEKLEQAKEAALQVIAGLDEGESFNVISYSDEVSMMSERPVVKNKQTVAEVRQWIGSIKAQGSTNLHAALQRAIKMDADDADPNAKQATLPIVMFLTDGLPTVGETSEARIRDVVKNQNPNQKRVFTFGVGYDVNAPLLEKISKNSRGFATFVKPNENVEVKVSRVFGGLNGPMLQQPQVLVSKGKGEKQKWVAVDKHKRISHVQPGLLPDLYEGDQLVVLGRYHGKKPLQIQIRGSRGQKTESFRFEFDIKASTRLSNSFVPRLWASRRIAELVDKAREMGATPVTLVSTNDSRESQLKELTDEIVRLSKEFGILTEYTAFLAEEGVDLADVSDNNRQTRRNLELRAIGCRSGIGAVNQIFNDVDMNRATLNIGNFYWSADMQQASIARVQQCNNRAYFRQGDRWIDNRLIDQKDVTADRTIELGSREYFELVWKMVDLDRNGELAFAGDVLVEVEGERILVKAPETKK